MTDKINFPEKNLFQKKFSGRMPLTMFSMWHIVATTTFIEENPIKNKVLNHSHISIGVIPH